MRIPYSLILATAAMAVTLALTPLVAALSRRLGALDHPGERRIHTVPIPTLGGLAMVAAVLGVAWAARALPGAAQLLDQRPLLGLTLAALLVTVLGVVDDVRGTPPFVKLLWQTAAALILVGFGFGIPAITNPFGEPIQVGELNATLTVVWVLVVMNAINVIDGLDGLASGVVCIAAMTLWWVGRAHEDFYVMFVASMLIGATLGFLRYNFPPARVFMGDTGSQFLGLTLAAVTLLEHRKGVAAVTLLFPLVAMAVPIADTLLAMLRRGKQRRSVFRADAEHIHHRLLRLGLSPRRVLFVLWFLSGYFAVMAVVLEGLPRGQAVLMALVLALGLFFAFEALEFFDRQITAARSKRDSAERR